MIDHFEYLEGYRDAQAYDVEEGGYDADYPLTEQLAHEFGGPLLDLACGTGTMTIRMAEQGFQVIGNAFQHFLTRADQEALLARVREHLSPQGCFLFGTRHPSLRNLFEGRYTEAQQYTMPDGRRYADAKALRSAEQPN